ncbi:MAG TPA: cysteine desulfurase family protein [Chthoniobacterales bacterium]|jgi:cysteine desulfurase|nr:cysteine desulfurase family protein [Chthoniobacterales bacterium]
MIYLDYNATTPLCDAAREAMLPYFSQHFGNPSSIHRAGRNARAAIDNARDKIAALIKAKPNEIVFTGGGTESCNLAVLGLARCKMDGGGHIICEKTEHHAVLHAVEHLEKHGGFEVTWLDASNDGIIDLDQLAKSIRPETRLVSIMAANNETGVIQPLKEISKICRERGVLLHSDMVQSFGKIDIDPAAAGLVDAASFAAHKFYGPKGAGFLFLRSGLSLQPVLFGGSHENQRRPGTENVPAIAGMAAAAEFVLANRQAEQDRQLKLRDELWNLISQNVPDAKLNGENAPRLANTLNVSLLGIDSEMLLIALDLKGVCASSGSACMVGSVSASHVLLAMGLPVERARSAVRFSLGKQTTAEEIAATGKIVAEIVNRVTKRKSAHAVA